MTVLAPFHRVERFPATAAWFRFLATAGALSLGACPAGAQDDSAGREQVRSLMGLDLAALGRLQVFSASRELTSIEQSPSVVTLITAEEIRRRGYKRLADVFDRVPGFYNSHDIGQSLIAARGFVQNPNNNFLLLVDGHSINSVADEGIGNNHLMPQLHQVKRIEILRGPGSTLWGGDAANGIINLITFDGRDLAESEHPFSEVVVGREFGRPLDMASFLGGIRQQRHIDRVMRHQFGEKGPALEATEAFGLGIVQVEEIATDGIPERRVPLLIAVADDLGHHRVGETLRMAGYEQQATAGIEFRPGRTHQFRHYVEAGQQAITGQVVAL